jgi:hypothetical protein
MMTSIYLFIFKRNFLSTFKPSFFFFSLMALLLVFFLFMVTGATSSSDPPPPSVYELLPKFGLPSGLLPDTVTNYTLSDDGRFVVVLPGPCYVPFEYTVYYEGKITGKLSYGSITDLKGIQVQRFFYLWFDVDEIKVDLPPSDSIYFQVGLINKRLDVRQFKTVHSCRAKSSSLLLQLPAPVNEVEMLVTE